MAAGKRVGEGRGGTSSISQRQADCAPQPEVARRRMKQNGSGRCVTPPCFPHPAPCKMHLTTLFQQPLRKSAVMSQSLQNNIMNN